MIGKRKIEVMTYNYAAMRLGHEIAMNVLYGPMVKYRRSQIFKLIGFVT